ncbi:hypothetical protein MRB53_030608 [Persea americana]|uniref:Uncharacterized protein n=1 Tax=Persea americana TaxID=3435 RepID=A0ACC2KM97_PERAE|nr:hypothetical protein MRB53_030608 [Persea americana]
MVSLLGLFSYSVFCGRVAEGEAWTIVEQLTKRWRKGDCSGGDDARQTQLQREIRLGASNGRRERSRWQSSSGRDDKGERSTREGELLARERARRDRER